MRIIPEDKTVKTEVKKPAEIDDKKAVVALPPIPEIDVSKIIPSLNKIAEKLNNKAAPQKLDTTEVARSIDRLAKNISTVVVGKKGKTLNDFEVSMLQLVMGLRTEIMNLTKVVKDNKVEPVREWEFTVVKNDSHKTVIKAKRVE